MVERRIVAWVIPEGHREPIPVYDRSPLTARTVNVEGVPIGGTVVCGGVRYRRVAEPS